MASFEGGRGPEGGDSGIGSNDAGRGGDSNIGSLRDNAESNTESSSLNNGSFESNAEINPNSNGELEFDAEIDSIGDCNLEFDTELNSNVENATDTNIENTATDSEDDENDEFTNNSEIDFKNTANTPEELEIIQDMRENGEYDELQESSNEPKEITFNLPSEKTGTFEGEPGNSAFRPNN